MADPVTLTVVGLAIAGAANHPTAADFAVALKWLHDEKSDGTNADGQNPVAAAIEQLRLPRTTGGRLSSHDDADEL